MNAAASSSDPNTSSLENVLDAPRVYTLYRLCKLVSASLDPQSTLNAITGAAHQLTNAQQTALILFDDLGNLELSIARGPIFELSGRHFASEEGVLGRAIREQRLVVLKDIPDEPDRAHPDLDERFKVRACMVAPLVWRGEVLGAVTTAHDETGVFTDADARLLEELAEQAAAAVAHARDFAAEQRRREMTEDIMRRLADLAAQLERAQQQLIHNEKMTAVGQLVHGLAHEMNTPLNVVTSNMAVLGQYTEMLSKIARAAAELEPTAQSEKLAEALAAEDDLDFVLEDLPALVDDSTSAAGRLAGMVRSIASMARHDRGTRAPVTIEDALESALILATNSLKKKARVERTLHAVPQVMGHSTELIELFVHLLMNAAQALEEKPGVVKVETLYEAPSVVVRISDDGAGIAPESLQRVFDPFFTTRPTGQGTGMGLAVCQDIVSRHGGEISLDSSAGRGTTVTVRLPASTAVTG